MRLSLRITFGVWVLGLLVMGFAAYLDQFTLTLAGSVTTRVTASVVFALLVWLVLNRVLSSPLERLALTLRRAADGDLGARTGIALNHEIGDCARVLDQFLIERQRDGVQRVEAEELLVQQIEQLAVATEGLARGELQVQLPPVRGLAAPLSLALNALGQGLAASMERLKSGAHRVVELSNNVKLHADQVVLIARREREELEQARGELQDAAETMAKVARLATASSEAADRTIAVTRQTRGSVDDALAKMEGVRDVLGETERRVKRLGERSQEIAGAAEDIGLVSERTQVLALNAGIQAAQSSGQAQGFGVVADEVQRLAQLVQGTSQDITRAVNAIQTEAGAALVVLSELIDQVVASSQGVLRCGTDIGSTEEATARLVRMVQNIAAAAVLQVKVTRRVEQRARGLLDGIGRTGEQLVQQGEATEQLLDEALAFLREMERYRLPHTSGDSV